MHLIIIIIIKCSLLREGAIYYLGRRPLLIRPLGLVELYCGLDVVFVSFSTDVMVIGRKLDGLDGPHHWKLAN